MKRTLLVLVVTLFISVLYASPMDEIDDWASKQTTDFDASDVVTFMNGRAEGDITYGSEYVFNSDITFFVLVAVLDATHFVVAYRDDGNSNYGTAVIGTVSGNTISYDSEYVFNSAYTNHISVAVLDASHFVVSYSDAGNSNYGTAVIGTVSGNTISYGSEYVFNSAESTRISAAVFDAAHFVVSYRDVGNSNYGASVIGTVSGNSISYGSEYVFNPAATEGISVAVFNASHFVVAYQDDGNSSYGTAVIGTVSGNTISYGSEYVFNPASMYVFISAAVLDASHFVVSYWDEGNSGYGTSIIGTISGNTISYGSEYVFNTNTTYKVSVAVLDATHFVVAFKDGYLGDGAAVTGKVSGSSISYSSLYYYNSAWTEYVSAAALDANHFVVSYSDFGNSRYGTVVVGEVELPLPTPVELSTFTAVYTNGSSLLEWTTQTESNNMGWNIYRSETGLEDGVQVNGHLIHGAGTSTEPTYYVFADETPTVIGTTYNYWLESRDYSGNDEIYGPISLTIPEQNQENPDVPDTAISKARNYPNPFAPNTEISFSLGQPAHVSLTIYNIKGQEIVRLFNGYHTDGEFRKTWNGRDMNGKEVSSGIYTYIIKAGAEEQIGKMILTK
ncbi:MAG: T9SS type A sorting domain-containing protein [Candidatus Cloacimonetes bacterium]|nr:T9SS type A sorting domain-containing protein [Candidatus Cloacimonadota bacterium]